jgi:hypothetical protein
MKKLLSGGWQTRGLRVTVEGPLRHLASVGGRLAHSGDEFHSRDEFHSLR